MGGDKFGKPEGDLLDMPRGSNRGKSDHNFRPSLLESGNKDNRDNSYSYMDETMKPPQTKPVAVGSNMKSRPDFENDHSVLKENDINVRMSNDKIVELMSKEQPSPFGGAEYNPAPRSFGNANRNASKYMDEEDTGLGTFAQPVSGGGALAPRKVPGDDGFDTMVRNRIIEDGSYLDRPAPRRRDMDDMGLKHLSQNDRGSIRRGDPDSRDNGLERGAPGGNRGMKANNYEVDDLLRQVESLKKENSGLKVKYDCQQKLVTTLTTQTSELQVQVQYLMTKINYIEPYLYQMNNMRMMQQPSVQMQPGLMLQPNAGMQATMPQVGGMMQPNPAMFQQQQMQFTNTMPQQQQQQQQQPLQAQRPAQTNQEMPKSRNPPGNTSSNNTSDSNYYKKPSRWEGRSKDPNGGSSKSNGGRRAGGGQTNGAESRGRRLNNNDQLAESDTDQDYYVGQKDRSHKSGSKRNKVEVEIEFEENEDIYEYGQNRKGRPQVVGEKHRREGKIRDASDVEDHDVSEDSRDCPGRGKKNLEGNYVSSNNDAELNGQNRRRKEVERSRDSENNTEDESVNVAGAELEINALLTKVWMGGDEDQTLLDHLGDFGTDIFF